MRRTTRTLATAVAVVGIAGLGAGPALAHECFVANRSAQGDAAVSAHSAAWFTLTPEVIFGGIFGLTGDALTCAVDAWNSDPSLPSYLVVGGKQAVGQGGVIAENNPNFVTGLASDGKGIDHAEDVYGAAAFAIVQGCTAVS